MIVRGRYSPRYSHNQPIVVPAELLTLKDNGVFEGEVAMMDEICQFLTLLTDVQSLRSTRVDVCVNFVSYSKD